MAVDQSGTTNNSVDQLSGSLTGSTATPGGTSHPAKKSAPKKKASTPSGHQTNADPLGVMVGAAPAKAPAKKAPARASRSRSTAPQSPQDMTLESVLSGIKQQESGGNYTARSSSSTASGAYQYLDSTWNGYGGYAHAWQAPPAVQDQRARADFQANFRKYHGDWRKVVAAHFAGSGWVDRHPDPNTWDQNPAPGSNNPTVAHYVASVFSNAGMATNERGAVAPGNTNPGVSGQSATGPTPVGPGQVGDASMGQTLGANATDQQVKDYVSKNYGYLVGFLHDPELGPLLLQAAREGWDKDVLAGKLTQTNYWKHTSDTARLWDAQTRTDPAAQHQLVGNKMAELAAEARKIGVVISPLKLHDLAVTSQRMGWNADQIDAGLRAQGTLDSRSGTARDFDQLAKDDPASAKQAVVNQSTAISQDAVKLGVSFQGTEAHDIAVEALRGGWDTNRIRAEILAKGLVSATGTGAIQTGINGLKASAGDYLVKVSDPTLLQWSKDIASGKFTQDDFTNYLKEQAKSLFPGMADAIDRGVTPSHYVDPYRQYAASILDVNPDSIDFVNDPKYSKALFNIDPKTGQRTQMSLADWQTYLRQQPEYANTASAVDQGAQFATMLGKTFGAIA